MTKVSFKLIFAALAATAALAGCTKEINSEYGRTGDKELSVTATIEGGTKVSYEKVDGALQPGWEMGDRIIGFDDAGNTYGYEVTDISESGEATLSRIRSDEDYRGSAPTYFGDGTKMYMFYAPGSKPSDITDKSLSVSIADQSENTIPAVMMAQATVEDNSLRLQFRNKTAIIGITNPQMEFPDKEYTAVALSGQGIKTEVVFSIDGNGELQASYQTEGPVRKALNLTSDETGVLNGVIYIVACPTEEQTDLTFTFNEGDETFIRKGFTIEEGVYYSSNPDVDKTSFKITIDDAIENGTLTTDPADESPWGETVKINSVPAEGYKLKDVSITGDDSGKRLKNKMTSFPMPKENVTITGVFVLETYNITSDVRGGTCQIQKDGENVTTANFGDEISVTIVPNEGYSGGTVTVTKVNAGKDPGKDTKKDAGKDTGEEIEFKDGKFTMPASDVKITVEFTHDEYSLSCQASPVEGGSVRSLKDGKGVSAAYFGDIITVDYSAKDYYTLQAIAAVDASGNPVSITDNSFTMPKSNVSVTATFVKKSYSVSAGPQTNGTFTVSTTSIQWGETVTISDVTPNTGYEVGRMYYSNGTTEVDIVSNSFTMPKSDVTVYVDFTKVDYEVSTTTPVNGSFKVKNSSGTEISEANYQDVITVDATADDGYIVDAITVTDADSNPVTVSGTTFTMPASSVTVSVTFKAQYSGPNPPDYNIEKW